MASYILVITGSGNGVAPVWFQAIAWNNGDLLSIEHLGINFSEILIKAHFQLDI